MFWLILVFITALGQLFFNSIINKKTLKKIRPKYHPWIMILSFIDFFLLVVSAGMGIVNPAYPNTSDMNFIIIIGFSIIFIFQTIEYYDFTEDM